MLLVAGGAGSAADVRQAARYRRRQWSGSPRQSTTNITAATRGTTHPRLRAVGHRFQRDGVWYHFPAQSKHRQRRALHHPGMSR